MQWLADNWFLVLTALVAIYGVFVGTKSLGVAKKSLGLAHALAKREVTEDVSIEWVFLTHKADQLRVEIVNQGAIPVPIRTVGIYKPGDENGFILQWCKGDSDSPLEPCNHSIYTRPVVELLGFTEVPGAYVAVWSNKQELDRTKGDEVTSRLAEAQARRSK